VHSGQRDWIEEVAVAIPMNTQVSVLLVGGEKVTGEVAQADQVTYLCLRKENETLYVPWTAIKCVRGPSLPERSLTGGYAGTTPRPGP